MPSLIGDRAYNYDLSGNQSGWDHVSNGTRRTIVWDEENCIQSVADNGCTQTYRYDDADERVIKRGAQGKTAYANGNAGGNGNGQGPCGNKGNAASAKREKRTTAKSA